MCMNYGLDFLALAKYPARARKSLPDGWALGAFTYVDGFGNSLPAVERVIADGRCPMVRLHGQWKDSHRFNKEDIKVAAKEAERVMKLVERRPDIKWYFSPWCEYDKESAKLMDECHKTISSIIVGKAEFVATPLFSAPTFAGVLNEFHGHDKKPRAGRCAFSYDGTAAEDSDVEAYKENYAKSEYFMLWSPEFNCRYETNDKTPRPKRTHKPSLALIQSLVALSDSGKGLVKLPSRWLYKSHAENKGNGDPRANKPVMIAPIKTKKIEFYALNGKLLHTLSYYGLYSDGRARYYASEWGYKLAEKAVKLSGDPRVKVVAQGKGVGMVHPAFRAGSFRD